VRLRDGRETLHEVGDNITNTAENRMLILKQLQASGVTAIDVEFTGGGGGGGGEEEDSKAAQPQSLATVQRARKSAIASVGGSAPSDDGPRLADYTLLASSRGMKESLR